MSLRGELFEGTHEWMVKCADSSGEVEGEPRIIADCAGQGRRGSWGVD